MSESNYLQEFKDQASTFPESPGIYIMKDADGVPIYIGKAINLRSRVRSYFFDDHDGRYQIPFMLRRLRTIEWIVTQSETEALILEANLIRKHKPKFNIDLRDDKHYPYLKITINEPFPRLLIVRRVLPDGARYFGPYTDATAMRRLAIFASRIFKIRDCARILPLDKPVRPCINFSMGRCSGGCAGKISQEDYRASIDLCVQFLAGHRKDILRILDEKMKNASQELDFEVAASLRDQAKLIQDASKLQRVDLRLPDEDCDVIGIYDGEGHLCLAILVFREGLLMSSRNFVVKKELWETDAMDHDHLVIQLYLEQGIDLPPRLHVPDNRGFNPEVLAQGLLQQFGRTIEVSAPQRGPRVQLVDIATKNARLYLATRVPHDAQQGIDALQQALSLPRQPQIIEAFDISNLGQAFAVAGMVRFTDGVPDKSEYRRFKIKGVEGQNDFAMMMEVVGRRLRRLIEENKPFPDLLLIDGGKGQLHAALDALKEFPDPPMIVSLAKREEELFTPFSNEPVRLPQSHIGRKLAERIRDEVHRWAVGFHRAVRGKQFKGSVLENIEGIGPSKARLLLKTFGSVRRIREATIQEIAAVKGFSLESAQVLADALNSLK